MTPDFTLEPAFDGPGKHETLEFMATPGEWISTIDWVDTTPQFKHKVKMTVWWEDGASVLDSYQWKLADTLDLDVFWFDTFTSQDLYAYQIEVEWHDHHGDSVGVQGSTVPAPGALALLLIAGAVGMWKGRGR